MAKCFRRSAVLALAAIAVLASGCSQPAHQANAAQSNDAVTAYLGVVPSAVVRREHPGRVLHPLAPAGSAHIVVALYDAVSGARIENASVEAVIRGERHRARRRIRLDPMRIEGTVTYGGFVSLARDDRYHVKLLVRTPDSTRESELEFLFDARSLPAPN